MQRGPEAPPPAPSQKAREFPYKVSSSSTHSLNGHSINGAFADLTFVEELMEKESDLRWDMGDRRESIKGPTTYVLFQKLKASESIKEGVVHIQGPLVDGPNPLYLFPKAQANKQKKPAGGSWKCLIRRPPGTPTQDPHLQQLKRAHQALTEVELDRTVKKKKVLIENTSSSALELSAVVTEQPRRPS